MKKTYLLWMIVLWMAPTIAKNPNFSLKNKSTRDIIVKVSPQGELTREQRVTAISYIIRDITRDKSVLLTTGGYYLGTPGRIGKDRSLELTLADTDESNRAAVYNLEITYVNDQGALQTLHSAIHFQKYATFYVKFQEKNGVFTLMPQEGSFFKTTEGYSLTKNISKKDLHPLTTSGSSFKSADVLDLE